MEEGPAQRRGSRAYQIFPEANLSEESDYPEDFLYKRERLPSIVVEPTELSEQESGELSWPPGCPMGHGVEEEEEESNSYHTEGSVDGEQQEDMDEGSAVRKSSIGPSQSQLSLFRLTPPASPTPPEAAPPCLRS
ncbi:unnamed protein product [Ophioblennius macclurei]